MTRDPDFVTQLERAGTAHLRRRQNREHHLLVTDAHFGDLFETWIDHARTWSGEPDPLSQTMMRQGLAALALHLSNRPRDESTAFTVNFRRPPTNVFLTGDAAASTVTGRVHTENVRVVESSRLFVQTQRPRGGPTQSTIEISTLDLLDVFESYYKRSEQHPARFFEVTEEDFIMVVAFPGATREFIEGLTREGAVQLVSESTLIEERVFRFHCGCDPKRMATVLHSLFPDPEELFQGEDGVETFCPRCGRRWWIRRDGY